MSWSEVKHNFSRGMGYTAATPDERHPVSDLPAACRSLAATRSSWADDLQAGRTEFLRPPALPSGSESSRPENLRDLRPRQASTHEPPRAKPWATQRLKTRGRCLRSFRILGWQPGTGGGGRAFPIEPARHRRGEKPQEIRGPRWHDTARQCRWCKSISCARSPSPSIPRRSPRSVIRWRRNDDIIWDVNGSLEIQMMMARPKARRCISPPITMAAPAGHLSPSRSSATPTVMGARTSSGRGWLIRRADERHCAEGSQFDIPVHSDRCGMEDQGDCHDDGDGHADPWRNEGSPFRGRERHLLHERLSQPTGSDIPQADVPSAGHRLIDPCQIWGTSRTAAAMAAVRVSARLTGKAEAAFIATF